MEKAGLQKNANKKKSLPESNLSRGVLESFPHSFEHAHIASFTLDGSGVIKNVNSAGCCLFKRARTAIMNRPFNAFVAPESQETFYLHCRNILSQRDQAACELVILRKGGVRFHALVESCFTADISGDITEWRSTVVDITDRKLREAAETREKEFKSLAENSLDITARVDSKLRFLYVNPAFERALRRSREFFLGKPLGQLGWPDDVVSYWSPIISAVFETKQTRHVEYGWRRSFFDVWLIPEPDEKGGIASVLLNARDVTGLKNIQQELIQTRSELEQRISERTEALTKAVNALKAEVLERARVEKELRKSYERLQAMSTELFSTEERERRQIATELHDQLGQVLAISKIKAGTLLESTTSAKPRKALMEIINLLDEAITDTRCLIRELNPPILNEMGFIPALDWLVHHMGDRFKVPITASTEILKISSQDLQSLLFRSIRELLMNAVKHARASHIWVHVRNLGSRLEIRVEDDGVGFEISYDKTANGFGLSSIRERIESLGGKMRIESRPGNGAIVSLVVPNQKNRAARAGLARELKTAVPPPNRRP